MSAPPNERLAAGKVPWSVLGPVLSSTKGGGDPSVIVGPGRGLDSAAISIGDRTLVTATDPVTFATDELGRYSVLVNANDVAVMGARPRWFQAVVLLPDCENNQAMLGSIMAQIDETLEDLGGVLVGGHSEVTVGLDRPIVVGQMMGDVSPSGLVRVGGAGPGDAVLVAGGVGIEATALVAREMGERLKEAGLSPREIEQAAGFLHDPGISIVRAALAAAATGAATAMHDVTEGGLATAAVELADASGVGVELFQPELPIATLTERVLEAVGMDPLGSIGSGGLLIACPQEKAEEVCWAVRLSGSACRVAGRLLGEKTERLLSTGSHREPLPVFEVDEIARVMG
jgi:hydrogenase maturation factor